MTRMQKLIETHKQAGTCKTHQELIVCFEHVVQHPLHVQCVLARANTELGLGTVESGGLRLAMSLAMVHGAV